MPCSSQLAEIIRNAAPLLYREVWMTKAKGRAAERLIRQVRVQSSPSTDLAV